MRKARALINELRAAHVDGVLGAVFDVDATSRGGVLNLVGETTLPDAVETLIRRLAEQAGVVEIVDEVRRLPDPALGSDSNALVSAALAPVLAEPRNDALQTSQYVLGHRLELLSRRRHWYRIRGEDGYVGWVHGGYLQVGPASWALAWERAEGGEPVVSLGAELVDEAGWTFARLPWGARLIRESAARIRLPDGRRGAIGAGELVDVDRLVDRFPPRAESIARTARRWVGAPYQWGGVTPSGVDCSGLVQAVFWLHGIALPRDSAQQARAGAQVEPQRDWSNLRPADLVFFSEEKDRITHVALSLGGAHIIHSAISLGGVEVGDLGGVRDLEQFLRKRFAIARRLLPDDR